MASVAPARTAEAATAPRPTWPRLADVLRPWFRDLGRALARDPLVIAYSGWWLTGRQWRR